MVQRGVITWSASTSIADGEPLGTAILRLLAEVPRRRWSRLRAVATVGPSAAQVKRLVGLPPLADRDELTRLISASVGRFFLRNGIPLRITDLRIADQDEVWAGAVETPHVDEIRGALSDLGIEFMAVLPTASVLGHATMASDTAISWHDADVCAETTYKNGEVVHARRIRRERASVEPLPPLRDPLDSLGDAAACFADAYAAAVVPLTAREIVKPATPTGGIRGRARVAAAAGLLVVGLAGVFTTPGLAARRETTRAEQRIRVLRERGAEVHAARQSLLRSSNMLRHVADHGARRRSMTQLLAALAVATPESTAIVSLRVDSGAVNIIAVARNGPAVLPALTRFPEFAEAAIAAPVVRETVGAMELERVVVRFKWAPERRRSKSANEWR